MRTPGPLALLLLLLGAVLAPVAARDLPEVHPTGAARPVALSDDAPVQVFAVTVPQGARRLHVAAAAPYDVDLHVHDGVLPDDELDLALLMADSVSMLEHVSLAPDAGERFSEPRTFYVHVASAGPEGLDFVASLAAWAETDEPVLVAGEALDLTLPAGARSATARLLLPAGLVAVRASAEAQRGVPVLRGVLAGVEVSALHRHHTAHLSLTGGPEVPAGAWQLEVGRPDGVPTSETCAVRLEVSLVPPTPEEDALTDDDALPLRGRRGERTLSLEQDGRVDLHLDVPPSVASVRIEATIEGGDVDLYATPSVPVDLGAPDNWQYGSWLDGPREVLLLGGTGSIRPGLYWLAVTHVDGEGGEVHLTWEGRPGPLGADEVPVSQGLLATTAHDVRLEANEAAVWWDLPPSIRAGGAVCARGADKDVDLLLVRTDTGAAVLRGTSTVHAETLPIPRSLVLPDAVELRVGLCRWQVTEPVAAGDLTAARGAPPPLPAAYFPPYDTFAPDARGRTLAAAVHLETDDSYGSGAVVAPTGLLLTCAHLIEDVPEGGDIYVSFPIRPRGRPRQLYLARVVESDETLDLALLELTRDVLGGPVPRSRRHPYVPVGDSSALALEAPLRTVGYGSAGSSSFGSNLGVLRGALVAVEMEGEREVWLLGDARLGPGNSGAGTFDAEGRLVGIHWGAYGETGQTLCYSRPISALPGSWRALIRAQGGEVPGP